MSTYDTPIRYRTFYTRYDMYRTILTTMDRKYKHIHGYGYEHRYDTMTQAISEKL